MCVWQKGAERITLRYTYYHLWSENSYCKWLAVSLGKEGSSSILAIYADWNLKGWIFSLRARISSLLLENECKNTHRSNLRDTLLQLFRTVPGSLLCVIKLYHLFAKCSCNELIVAGLCRAPGWNQLYYMSYPILSTDQASKIASGVWHWRAGESIMLSKGIVSPPPDLHVRLCQCYECQL